MVQKKKRKFEEGHDCIPQGHARSHCAYLSMSSARPLEEVGREPTASPRAVTEMLHFTKPFTPARVSVGSLITAHFWKNL